MDLAWNNLQRLIYYKIQPTNQPTNQPALCREYRQRILSNENMTENLKRIAILRGDGTT